MRRLWVFALSVASARAQGAFDCASLCEGFSCDSYSPQTCDAALSEFGCACAGCACDVARNGTNATNATVLRAAAEAVLGSIVDVAAATPELSSLVAAVAAAGLVGALAGDGPFTVLAPTNAAFEAVDLAALSDDELVDVLLYHVVPGVHAAADLAGVDGLETLYGQDVSVDVAEDGAVTFGGAATVVIADVEASNGVVHVIDAVLLPFAGSARPTAAPTTPPPTFSGAPTGTASLGHLRFPRAAPPEGATSAHGAAADLDCGGAHYFSASGDPYLEDTVYHYVVAGDGTGSVVVVLPGWRETWWAWRRTACGLADEGHTVLLVDPKGQGESDARPDLDYGVEAGARELGALLDALGVGDFGLIASDGGVALGDRLAADRGGRVTRYVRAAAPAFQDVEEAVDAAFYATADGAAVLAASGSLDLAADAVVAPPDAWLDALQGDAFDRAGRPEAAALAFGARGSVYATSETRREILADLAAPVLVVVGAEDDELPLAGYAGLGDDGACVALYAVDGSGHYPHVERPVDFDDQILDFFGACKSSSQCPDVHAGDGFDALMCAVPENACRCPNGGSKPPTPTTPPTPVYACDDVCAGFTCDEYVPATCELVVLEYGCDCAGCRCELVNGTAYALPEEAAAAPTATPTLLFEGDPVAGEWFVADLSLDDAKRYEGVFVSAVAAAADVDERAVAVELSEADEAHPGPRGAAAPAHAVPAGGAAQRPRGLRRGRRGRDAGPRVRRRRPRHRGHARRRGRGQGAARRRPRGPGRRDDGAAVQGERPRRHQGPPAAAAPALRLPRARGRARDRQDAAEGRRLRRLHGQRRRERRGPGPGVVGDRAQAVGDGRAALGVRGDDEHRESPKVRAHQARRPV